MDRPELQQRTKDADGRLPKLDVGCWALNVGCFNRSPYEDSLPPLRIASCWLSPAASLRGDAGGMGGETSSRESEGGHAGGSRAGGARWADSLPRRLWTGRCGQEDADHAGDEIPHRLGDEAIHRRRDPESGRAGQTGHRRSAGEIFSRGAECVEDYLAAFAHAHFRPAQLHRPAGFSRRGDEAGRARGLDRLDGKGRAGLRARDELQVLQLRLLSPRRDRRPRSRGNRSANICAPPSSSRWV